ncbi:MAG: AAA family ATPase [Candidatus Thermoplasmatota archaeon]|nr:AAA family ATPase [Candidatus Thermoplasmatota archaeon]
MKLIELEIENVRGITHIKLTPQGKNIVIWGPNGSGKSAVVDAIDFLLTGRISRLKGEGTRNIKLKECGPHIDHKPKDAIVRAVIQFPKINVPIEIKRDMAQPTKLVVSDEKYLPNLEPILSLASRGEHVLTRREILKYITSDGSTRAQEIQALLNISDIEIIRKAFVNIENTFKREKQTKEEAIDEKKGEVNATIQTTSFNEKMLLDYVNQLRKTLKSNELNSVSSDTLKKALTPPTSIINDNHVNLTIFEKDIQNIHNSFDEKNQKGIIEFDKELRNLLNSIKSNPKLLKTYNRFQLIELGKSMIDDTGNCPLCDTQWPSGKLDEYLTSKLTDIEEISQQRNRITSLSDSISKRVNNTRGSINKIIEVLNKIEEKEWSIQLKTCSSDLNQLSIALANPLEKYPLIEFDSDRVKHMLISEEIKQNLQTLIEIVKTKAPPITPEQTAWDTLTRLEENLKGLEKAKNDFKNASISYKKAEILLNTFEYSRDTILGNLYKDVNDRFVQLYKELHGSDEKDFSATISPDGAALKFEVDFYGRGAFSPQALHSEGHQDSMGLCLYLALSERLAEGLIDLIILDDVIMSVDSNHRRDICRVLASNFPNRQFLITTHDKTWANQMRSEGVVDNKSCMVEFYNWKVDTGPQVNLQADLWSKIEEDLTRNDVPSAASRLRRGLEEYFGLVCDSLQIRVRYKLNGQLDLGDFTIPLMDGYKDLIKKAKKSSVSWEKSEKTAKFEELDSMRSSIYKRTYAEQWGINANVHFNNWINFSDKDFRPIKEAFQDLYYLFSCHSCGGILKITADGMKQSGVRCNCGSVNWNLISNNKEEKK